MSSDLDAFTPWANALLARLQPGQRAAVSRKVAQDLRRSQSQRIGAQRDPDGAGYTPRKARKGLREKQGRIKRQRAAMFTKLRMQKNLQAKVDGNEIAVGFFGRVARIARVHQEGLPDRVARNGPIYHYPARVLLGFAVADREAIRESLLRHLDL